MSDAFGLEASRAAALAVYSAYGVPGAPEWLRSGDERHLPRAWREQLVRAAGKIRLTHAPLFAAPRGPALELPQ